MSVTGVFYGILFGLIIISVLDTHDKISDIEYTEAAAIRKLYIESDEVGGPAEGNLKALERRYVKVVVDEEWPAQQAGLNDSSNYLQGFVILREIRRNITRADTSANGSANSLLRAYDQLVTAREHRMANVEAAIPSKIWTAIVALTLVNMLFLWLLKIENFWLDLALNAAIGLAIGVVFAFCFLYDNPFRGETSIAPSNIEAVFHSHMNS